MKSIITVIAFALIATVAQAVWRMELPDNTRVVVPLRHIDVVSVSQPLPGDDDTDTEIDLSYNRTIHVNTNGVAGTAMIISSFRVTVTRQSIEDMLGEPVGEAKQKAVTNAVRRIAFAKLGYALNEVSQGLNAPDE